MKNIIGFHIDNIDNIDNVNNIETIIKDIKKIKCKIIQIFVNPMKNNKDNYNLLKKCLKKNKIYCVVHISYTINCAQNWNEYSWWIKQLILEIELAAYIGAISVIIHIGKQLNLTIEECYNNMYSSLLYIHQQTIKYSNMKILIETPAGQGTEMCYKMEDLAYFYNKFSNHKNNIIQSRFGICLDTCHIFAAGYDISNKKNINKYIENFNELIGIEQIKLIHLNDSKNILGSHKDRHECLGKGYIGLSGLLIFAKLFNMLNIPIILETPTNKNKNAHKIEIEQIINK